MSEFDNVSENYEDALSLGISLSGENSDYFACIRVDHMARVHARIQAKTTKIMDYGCGTGGSIGHLLKAFNPDSIVALDTSGESLKILRQKYCSKKISTVKLESNFNKSSCDLCYCNGVFHHILPKNREEAAKFVFDSLNKGGFFYFWENNPWNPATHWVMSRIPFDRKAVKIFPHQAVQLLQNVGFEIKLIHYLFIFPRFLKILDRLKELH